MHGCIIKDDVYGGLQVDSQAASGCGLMLLQKTLVLPGAFISFCMRPLSALLLPFPEHAFVAWAVFWHFSHQMAPRQLRWMCPTSPHQ